MAHLNKDLVHLICLYLNIDEYDAIKDNYKLDMRIYCKNVYVEERYLIQFFIEKGNLDMIKYLHAKGADLMLFMFWAIRCRRLEIVKFLYSAGARCSWPELNWAYYYKQTEIVEYFQSMGETTDCSKPYRIV